MASSEPATKKLKLPTLADAGQTLGAADAFLESLPEAQSSTSAFSNGGGNNANGLAFGSCHLPPRLLLDTFPAGPMRPDAAAQLLRDFRALDSRPSLNVASFVTTQVEPECRELMAEALTINYIDEEEYPSTAQIHNQCVAQLGDLLSAEKDEVGGENGAGGKGKHCGTSTVGSSEAILLCYLAMKRRWQERRKAAGLPVAGVQCSVVVPSCYHVCHEKACNYWEIEMRVAPLKNDRYFSVAEDLMPLVDASTIGVVAILGSTYTGHFDDVAGISAALMDYNAKNPGLDVGLHVDGASGGFIAATLFPHLKADFRSPAVISMNLSGHKTGQVVAGVGWAMFRSRKFLPESLVFHDSYLGNDQISFTLNFSKGASQIMGQAYMFLRLGRSGYQQVLGDCWRVSSALGDLLTSAGAFEVVSPRAPLPGVALVAFRLAAARRGRGFDEHDLSDGLRERGWIVPAYPLPAGTEEGGDGGDDKGVAPLVLRVVCRADLSFGLAATLASDVVRALERLEARAAASKDREQTDVVAARATQAWRSAKNKARAKRRHEAQEAAKEAEELRAKAEAAASKKTASAADLASKAAEKGAEAAEAAASALAEGGMRHGGVC